MCWVTPNLSASSATDVKPWQNLTVSAGRFEGSPILFGARKTPEVSRVEPNLSAHLKGSSLRDQADRLRPRSVGRSHRPAGSWAYDHGVAAHLSLQRTHLRSGADDCLGSRHSDLTCAVFQGLALPQAARTSVLRGGTCSATEKLDFSRRYLLSPSHPTSVAWMTQPSGSSQRQGLRISRESSDSKRFPRETQTSSLRTRQRQELSGRLAQWCDYQERHSGFGHRLAVRT